MNKTFGEDRTCSYARGETQNRQTDRHGHHNTPPPPIGVGVNNNNLPDSGVGNMSGVRSDRMSKSPSKTLRDRPSFTSARRGHNYLTFVLTRIRAVHKVCPALTHSSWRKTACSVLVSDTLLSRADASIVCCHAHAFVDSYTSHGQHTAQCRLYITVNLGSG